MLLIIAAVVAFDQVSKIAIEAALQPVERIIGDWFRFLLVSTRARHSHWAVNHRPGCLPTRWSSSSACSSHRASTTDSKQSRWPWSQAARVAPVDRLLREPGFWFGHVVDFISVGDFAIFNVADSFSHSASHCFCSRYSPKNAARTKADQEADDEH